jgi:hypothetical protein
MWQAFQCQFVAVWTAERVNLAAVGFRSGDVISVADASGGARHLEIGERVVP